MVYIKKKLTRYIYLSVFTDNIWSLLSMVPRDSAYSSSFSEAPYRLEELRSISESLLLLAIN